jgi:Xaa-Pro aminopeptidase
MRFTEPGRYEFEIAAELMHEYGRNNATAYRPFGGGANSHPALPRERCPRPMATCCWWMPAVNPVIRLDITRTAREHITRGAARRVRRGARGSSAIAATKPATTNQAHEAAVEVIWGLQDWACSRPRQADQGWRYRKFFMHRTGHWLGMDVGDYKVGEEWAY